MGFGVNPSIHRADLAEAATFPCNTRELNLQLVNVRVEALYQSHVQRCSLSPSRIPSPEDQLMEWPPRQMDAARKLKQQFKPDCCRQCLPLLAGRSSQLQSCGQRRVGRRGGWRSGLTYPELYGIDSPRGIRAAQGALPNSRLPKARERIAVRLATRWTSYYKKFHPMRTS